MTTCQMQQHEPPWHWQNLNDGSNEGLCCLDVLISDLRKMDTLSMGTIRLDSLLVKYSMFAPDSSPQ